MAEVAEPPAQTTPQAEVELSKSTFRDAMAAEKAKQPQAIAENPDIDATPTEPAVEPTPENPAEPAVTQTPPAADEPAKSKVPEELLSGKKSEPKVDEALAAIDAMVLPKNAKPEQVASFGKLKEESKRIILEKQQRISELESKTSDAAPRAEIESANERVKAAETRARELESQLERVAFTESPKFKRFLDDEAATLASAKS